jgi:uncharacterized protein YyaL (SSP411 family)
MPLSHLEEVASKGREKLYEVRERRVHPGRDDKVLVAWNGLMLRAFAEAAAILERDDYRTIAIRNAEFIMSKLVQDGDRGSGTGGQSGEPTLTPETELRLYRTYKDGRAHIEAFAEDYAFYADGLLSLYEATFEPTWAARARSLITTLLNHFWDARNGGFFSTGDFHEDLVSRPKELYDNAIPSANSVAAEALIRLYLLTAEPDYERRALDTMRPLLDALGRAPTAFGRMLCALDFYLGSPAEVALIGDMRLEDMLDMLRAVWRPYVPNKVVAAAPPGDTEAARVVPLLAERTQVDNRATAYVCRNYICQAPTTNPSEVERLLARQT